MLLYYATHKIASADMLFLSKSLARGNITNSGYRYDKGAEIKAASNIQREILTDCVLVRAREIVRAAEADVIDNHGMTGQQLRTHLLDIFNPDR